MSIFGSSERGVRLRLVFSFLIALTAFCVLLLTASAVQDYIERNTLAVEWYGVRIETPVVKPGDILRMKFKVRVNKTCPADIRSVLLDPDGVAVVVFPVRLGGYTKPTDGIVEAPIAINIPLFADAGKPPFKDGVYTYRMIATRYCPEGIQEDAGAQDAPFRLDAQN